MLILFLLREMTMYCGVSPSQHCAVGCSSCLRSWLEQDTSCPTCRMSLSEPGALDLAGELSRDEGRNTALLLGALGAQDDAPRHPQNTTTNHFFHFDGKARALDVLGCLHVLVHAFGAILKITSVEEMYVMVLSPKFKKEL